MYTNLRLYFDQGYDGMKHEQRRRIIEAVLWYLGTLLLALFIPNIGVAINFAGSITAFFYFVFPGWWRPTLHVLNSLQEEVYLFECLDIKHYLEKYSQDIRKGAQKNCSDLGTLYRQLKMLAICITERILGRTNIKPISNLIGRPNTQFIGVRTFRPMQFQPMQFQPLPIQPFTISTACNFNRSHFQPFAISTYGNFNLSHFRLIALKPC